MALPPAAARAALAGFRTIFGTPSLRLVVGLYSAQTLVAGALNVLVVVTAIELLDLGRAGPGLLNSAIGVGGLIGAGAALALAGVRGLGSVFAVGLVLWGVPLVLLGAWPTTAAALLFLAVVGVGNTLVDVSGLTLLQRTAPPAVLARVFGVLEESRRRDARAWARTPRACSSPLFWRPRALVAAGLLPARARRSSTWARLRAIDARTAVPERELELLRALPLFAPLAPATLEHLAPASSACRPRSGTEITRQGDVGDRFYLVDEGDAT